ncbi:MAG: 2-oxo acid dehydrogenase subunit E2 [Oscillatoriales cyanobacterium]|nr:MAG: 2-oxo acid dehydrogenase subunit E2 [Oscillatoriales cyanobacterium]
MIHEVFMPALSSTMTEGKIVSWTKEPGDQVEKGETVVVVESDKADMDVESFYAGTLAAIIIPAGGTATVGAPIALLAETEAEIEEAKQKAAALSSGSAGGTNSAAAPAQPAVPTASAVPAEAPAAPAPAAASGRPIVSPRARKLAKTLKVDLATVNGSGPHGRIIADDVQKAAGKTPTPPVAVQAPLSTVPATFSAAPLASAAPAVAADITLNVPVAQLTPLTTMQRAVTDNMNVSLGVPVFRASYTIATDALDALYKKIKPKGVTMSALLAKAVADTLVAHPLLNTSYSSEGIRYPDGINIAMAVTMPDGGLITPVLKAADQQDIYSLSRTWKDLVARSRTKQLQPDEYNSGTFTISNLGMFGVDSFDAILPPGQGSILAIGASKPTVVANADGTLGVQRQMTVNITCDHRNIYGADAAAFLKDLADKIENDTASLTL